jgi:transcriptional regulator of arginine metabolism
MTSRNQRTDLIRSIVRSKPIKTQKELVTALAGLGQLCTQATISRDIAELGLRKSSGGHYILPEDLFLKRMVTELVIDITAAQNLVVVRTQTGSAQGVAAALDGVQLENIVGSIAGDDTILLVTATNELAEQLVKIIAAYQAR